MSDKAKDDSTPDGVLLIDVRGEAEAQRDGVIPGSLSSQCDRNSDVQECVNKGLAKGVVPQDPKTVLYFRNIAKSCVKELVGCSLCDVRVFLVFLRLACARGLIRPRL